jgi:hypothetical protein
MMDDVALAVSPVGLPVPVMMDDAALAVSPHVQKPADDDALQSARSRQPSLIATGSEA